MSIVTVPRFSSGHEVDAMTGKTVKAVEGVGRKSHPRFISKTGYFWDKSHDATLIHWVTVRKFSIAEIVRRCEFGYPAVLAQLTRLGLHEPSRVEWRSSWDRYLLDGMSGADVARLTGASQACVSNQVRRLGLKPRRGAWTRSHTVRLKVLWNEGLTITKIAESMSMSPRTITKHARRVGLRRK